jgi:hypothetical protein
MIVDMSSFSRVMKALSRVLHLSGERGDIYISMRCSATEPSVWMNSRDASRDLLLNYSRCI